MTTSHMISYGRSKHVQDVIKSMKKFSSVKMSRSFSIDVWDYLMCEMSIMNGFRALNLIEVTLGDIKNAVEKEEYPGQKVIENAKYKTLSIYGKKLIALPNPLFEQLESYAKYCRSVLVDEKKNCDYLFQHQIYQS